ncbi:hypothetical protein [Pseudorhodoplanes sp.]|uniref:hypothetical protein n=1 Tax=Pseudorhodoplanes sp. TaxID=1934341 RepID=UPI003D13D34A
MRKPYRTKRKPPPPPAPFPHLRSECSPSWRRTISQIGGTDEGLRWAAIVREWAEDARVLARKFEEHSRQHEQRYGAPWNYALERAAGFYRKADVLEQEAEALCATHPQQIKERQTLMDRYRPVLTGYVSS